MKVDKNCPECKGEGLVGTYYNAIDDNDVETCVCVQYESLIFNSTNKKYVKNEHNGVVEYTPLESEAVIFYEEEDAESTLMMLNDIYPDCFTLLVK